LLDRALIIGRPATDTQVPVPGYLEEVIGNLQAAAAGRAAG